MPLNGVLEIKSRKRRGNGGGESGNMAGEISYRRNGGNGGSAGILHVKIGEKWRKAAIISIWRSKRPAYLKAAAHILNHESVG
jgi:hypothetical protein